MEERVTIRLPTSQLARIDEAARARGISRSRVIRGIFEDVLDTAEGPEALAEMFADQDRDLERLRTITG